MDEFNSKLSINLTESGEPHHLGKFFVIVEQQNQTQNWIFTSVHKLRIISSKKDKTEVENKNNIRREEVIILARYWRDNLYLEVCASMDGLNLKQGFR